MCLCSRFAEYLRDSFVFEWGGGEGGHVKIQARSLYICVSVYVWVCVHLCALNECACEETIFVCVCV